MFATVASLYLRALRDCPFSNPAELFVWAINENTRRLVGRRR